MLPHEENTGEATNINAEIELVPEAPDAAQNQESMAEQHSTGRHQLQ